MPLGNSNLRSAINNTAVEEDVFLFDKKKWLITWIDVSLDALNILISVHRNSLSVSLVFVFFCWSMSNTVLQWTCLLKCRGCRADRLQLMWIQTLLDYHDSLTKTECAAQRPVGQIGVLTSTTLPYKIFLDILFARCILSWIELLPYVDFLILCKTWGTHYVLLNLGNLNS